MDTLPNELAVDLYRSCDSLGRIGLYLTWSRISRLGLRPPVRCNIIAVCVRHGVSIVPIESIVLQSEMSDASRLLKIAVRHNNLKVMDTLVKNVGPVFRLDEFVNRSTKRVNLDFVVWAAEHDVVIKCFYQPNALRIYCKHLKRPIINIVNYLEFVDVEILECVWRLSGKNMNHDAWNEGDLDLDCKYDVSAETYEWLQTRGFLYMQILRITQHQLRPKSQRIPVETDIRSMRWFLEITRRKFMRLTSLEMLQKLWDHTGTIEKYRADLYRWAMQTGRIYLDHGFHRHMIMKHGTLEDFQMMVAVEKPRLCDVVGFGNLQKLLWYIEHTGDKVHLFTFLEIGYVVDFEVAIWLYTHHAISIPLLLLQLTNHKNLVITMIKRKLLDNDDIVHILGCIATTYRSSYDRTIKKLLKRGHNIPHLKLTGRLLQLAERNHSNPIFT